MLQVLKSFLIDGVDTMRGETIPEPMTALEEFVASLKSAFKELYDAASGKSGVAGKAIVVLLLVFFGLLVSMVAMCFLPGKSDKEKVE